MRLPRIGEPGAERPAVLAADGTARDVSEAGAAIPERPVVFMKDPATVIGPFDEVRVPRGSRRTDCRVAV
jgi:2-keto-4-pentenoate hydratase/2-oxohepta-3-ene-1,7-dioic acid hydratase in catechol pathway